jgi:nucleoside-triphosphatase
MVDPLGRDLHQLFPDSCTQRGNILVVTGPRGVGKSTYCQERIQAYRQDGRKITGLLTPGRFDDGQKTGYFVVDQMSEISRLLASQVPGEIDGLRFGHWMFDPKGFEWGNECLQHSPSSDVLVIDELGFLEFDLHVGWVASFDLLAKKAYRLALVVIRPECVESFARLDFSFQVLEIAPRPQA